MKRQDRRPHVVASPSVTAVAVVPARMSSTRLPGKPLCDLGGLPIIEWVRRRLLMVNGLERVVIATEDEVIRDVVRGFGGEVVMTPPCPNGTVRVYEAAKLLGLDTQVILNVQGDMPAIAPLHVERMVQAMHSTGAGLMTAAVPMAGPSEAMAPENVKVVVDNHGHALYFSRAPIPHSGPWLRHLGIYGFTLEALGKYLDLEPGFLAKSEDLEQLRWIEAGGSIDVVVLEEALPV